MTGAAPVPAERVALGYHTYDRDAAVGPDGRVFAFVGATLQPRGTLALPEGRCAVRAGRLPVRPRGPSERVVRIGGQRVEEGQLPYALALSGWTGTVGLTLRR